MSVDMLCQMLNMLNDDSRKRKLRSHYALLSGYPVASSRHLQAHPEGWIRPIYNALFSLEQLYRPN